MGGCYVMVNWDWRKRAEGGGHLLAQTGWDKQSVSLFVSQLARTILKTSISQTGHWSACLSTFKVSYFLLIQLKLNLCFLVFSRQFFIALNLLWSLWSLSACAFAFYILCICMIWEDVYVKKFWSVLITCMSCWVLHYLFLLTEFQVNSTQWGDFKQNKHLIEYMFD